MSDIESLALPGIAVSGQGEVSGVPDVAAITLGVSVKRADAPSAMANAAAAATRLIDALRAAGVAERDLQTRNFSVTQEFVYLPDVAPRADGFRVTNEVVARVRVLADTGSVIDAAVTAAGDDAVVQGITFGLDDDAAARVEARDLAYADALAKAEQLARLAGRSLGPVVSVSETSSSSVAPFPMVRAKMAFDAASTPIQAGEVSTAVTIDVRWAFAD